MSRYLFKHIRIISPSEGIDEHRNLMIDEHGIISYPDQQPQESNNLIVIDAKGYIAAPGFVDMHVHLREPGQEYKETIATGTAAAAPAAARSPGRSGAGAALAAPVRPAPDPAAGR